MKIYENILKEFIDIPKNILETTNAHVSEVESFKKLIEIDNLVIGHVLDIRKHENADSLYVTTVDLGNKTEQIVCGASNVDKGQYVIVAQPGAILPGDFKIKPAKIRGVHSNGMICSLHELGIDEKIIPEEFQDGIFYFDQPKELGSNALKHLFLDGFIMELDLTPNRADLLSHYGFAKDLGAMINKKVNLPKYELKEINNKNELKVEIKSKNTNSYYARYIDNVEIKESPFWLKAYLKAMDCQPVNNVVDITNFILYTYGIPMHAFDADSFGSKNIVIIDNDKKQTLKTLDGNKYELTKDEILITNGKEPMAIAGIMGLENSMVTDKTKRVILEVASFSNKSVQKTSRKLNLRSDSSLRFERGINEELMEHAINHASYLINKYANGDVYSEISKDIKHIRKNQEIKVSVDNINKSLNLDLTEKEIINYLERYNYNINKKANSLLITAPLYRNDIKIEADVIEEIARIYGVDNIPNESLVLKGQGKLSNKQKRIRTLRHKLSYLGFNEVVTYSLLNEKDVQKYFEIGEKVSVLKPLTIDRKTLRQSIINGLLDVYNYNKVRNNENIFIYEIGNVYAKDIERNHLAVLASGKFYQNLWQKQEVEVDFYFLSGVLQNIMEHMDLEYELIPSNKDSFHPYQQANIMINNKNVGVIGKIHPKIAKDVFVFEINLEALKLDIDFKYETISKYPSIERDLAIVVKEDILTKDILALIKQTARKNLVNIEVFDVYKGKHIDEGYQSIAISMEFNDKNKTLETNDVDKIMKKIIRRIEIEFDGKIRS